MRYQILVRHSLPDIVPDVPGSLWQLSAEGRARCRFLAEQLSALFRRDEAAQLTSPSRVAMIEVEAESAS
jgi:hypothetical protein